MDCVVLDGLRSDHILYCWIRFNFTKVDVDFDVVVNCTLCSAGLIRQVWFEVPTYHLSCCNLVA